MPQRERAELVGECAQCILLAEADPCELESALPPHLTYLPSPTCVRGGYRGEGNNRTI
jgi:hypothetical protein